MTIKLRGIRVRRRLAGLWRVLLRCRSRPRPRRGRYFRLDHSPQREPPTGDCTIAGKLMSWTRRMCPFPLGSRTQTLPPFREPAPTRAPKGHLVVYVQGEGEEMEEPASGRQLTSTSTPQRVVVPVVYFNHPLFAELLREAERENGFRHPGGITLPCPYSDFESVRTRVAAAASAGLCCHSRGGAKRRWHLNRSS